MARSSGNANNPTRRPSTSIARSLALLMPSLPQIIRAGMHDDRTAQDALWPNKLDQGVLHAAFAVALAVGLEVAEVADVALAVGGGAVLLGVRVDCNSRERLISLGRDNTWG